MRWGLEPICRVLSEHGITIAPSTYYHAIKAQRRVTEQDLREERLMVAIARVAIRTTASTEHARSG